MAEIQSISLQQASSPVLQTNTQQRVVVRDSFAASSQATLSSPKRTLCGRIAEIIRSILCYCGCLKKKKEEPSPERTPAPPPQFSPSHPVGLLNFSMNCCFNVVWQLVMNVESYARQIRQIPEIERAQRERAQRPASDASEGVNRLSCLEEDYQTAQGHQARQQRSRRALGYLTQDLREHVAERVLTISARASNQEDPEEILRGLLRDCHPGAFYRPDRNPLPQEPFFLLETEQVYNNNPTPQPRGSRSEFMINVDLSPLLQPPAQGQAELRRLAALFPSFFRDPNPLGVQHHYFRTPPPEFMVCLRRFVNQGFVDRATGQGHFAAIKINDPISMPERYSLPPELVRSRETADYLCDFFVVHVGRTPHGGHYTAYKKNEDDSWSRLNDANVTPASQEEVALAMSNLYMAHYKKQPPQGTTT